MLTARLVYQPTVYMRQVFIKPVVVCHFVAAGAGGQGWPGADHDVEMGVATDTPSGGDGKQYVWLACMPWVPGWSVFEL